mgnify:CR=1 FL=1
MNTTLTASVIALAASAVTAHAETLTISWWGYNGDKLDANLIAPFKEKCGCDVVFETGNNADRLGKLTARGGKGVERPFPRAACRRGTVAKPLAVLANAAMMA